MATGVNPRRLSNGDEGILSRMMENDGISYEQAEKCDDKIRKKNAVKKHVMATEKIKNKWLFWDGGPVLV